MSTQNFLQCTKKDVCIQDESSFLMITREILNFKNIPFKNQTKTPLNQTYFTPRQNDPDYFRKG